MSDKVQSDWYGFDYGNQLISLIERVANLESSIPFIGIERLNALEVAVAKLDDGAKAKPTVKGESESAWQPIGTAPKDGTSILIRDYPEDSTGTVCLWVNDRWFVVWNHDEYTIDIYTDTTEWAPLPE